MRSVEGSETEVGMVRSLGTELPLRTQVCMTNSRKECVAAVPVRGSHG